jgi:ketosteroid isomerase-like protein
MSEENVEVVRQIYAAAERRDNAGVYSLWQPGIEWDASRTERGGMTGHVAYGRDEVQAWLRQWYSAWENVEDELEELIDSDGDRVVSVMTQRGRGRGSGIEVADRIAAVWVIRDGRVAKVTWFPTREQALEAAGLSE